jgi:DNA-directed RNA polymerase specialized sigma24 family protein
MPPNDTPPDHAPPEPTPPDADALLARMQSGDRDAVGVFIDVYGDRIRRRVRAQLRPGVRRVFDSQEILSTVARRLDELVHTGDLRATEEAQLWSLIFRIATNAVIDKSKALARLRRAEKSDRVFARRLLSQIERSSAGRPTADGAAEEEIARLLRAVPDPIDRQILELWLRDTSLAAIATALELPDGTVRRRWGNVKATLERHLRDD